MSLISICRAVLAETGWPVPSAIASNTDATAQQILAIANSELRALSEKFNWPHLRTEYDFVTVADQAQYEWPADFRYLAWDSVFDTGEYYRIKGSLPLREWQRWQHGLDGQLSHQRFLQGYTASGTPAITLSPAPDGVQSLTAFYFSNEYARSGDGSSIPQYVADTDVSKIPERLVELGVKWRFRRAKGLDFSAELAEYNSDITAQYAKYSAPGDIQVGGPSHLEEVDGGYVRPDGFGV